MKSACAPHALKHFNLLTRAGIKLKHVNPDVFTNRISSRLDQCLPTIANRRSGAAGARGNVGGESPAAEPRDGDDCFLAASDGDDVPETARHATASPELTGVDGSLDRKSGRCGIAIPISSWYGPTVPTWLTDVTDDRPVAVLEAQV
uniref:Uncharacterized protein n=1 Tax=Leersia perrieri TaxID=77586 RepID=A0A0D9XUP5_9ORYZ